MTDKVQLASLVNLNNQNTAVTTINSNSVAITAAMNNTLSRDGTAPNQMLSSLDMNSNQIVNLPAPSTANSPLRLQDLNDFLGGGTLNINQLPAGGTIGQVLAKNSGTSYDVGWQTLASSTIVANRTALAAINPNNIQLAFLQENPRQGFFQWLSGNYSFYTALDPNQGMYVTSSVIPVTSGVWKRLVELEGVYNVKWFGATGDNTTDDYAAVQSCINYAQGVAGGTIFFPKGGYKISAGLVINTPLVKLEGAGSKYSSITSTATNISMITVSAARTQITGLSVFNQVIPTTSNALISFTSGCTQTVMRDMDLVGGWYCIQFLPGCTNVLVDNIVARQAWGGAIMYNQGAGAIIIENCVFDQDWPVQVPTGANNKGARATSTAYNVGDYVTYGGVMLQCKTAGTSSTGAPTITWYYTNIPDGTVTWQVAGNANGCAVLIDSNSTFVTIKDTDLTGSYVNAVRLTDGLGTGTPDVIRIFDCTPAGMVGHAIWIQAGNGVWIEGCEIQACVGNGTYRGGIVQDNSSVGDVLIRGNRITSGFTHGIFILNSPYGSSNIFENMCFGLSYGIYINPGVSNFNICHNDVGTSSRFGTNTNGIVVGVGAGNNYIIANNRYTGSTLSDGGTGANKSVSGNV